MSAAYWLASKRPRPKYKNPWDVVFLDGRALPGLARIRSLGLEVLAQHKQPLGGDFGSDTVLGLRAPEFTVELEISHREEWEEFQRWVPVLVPAKDPASRNYLSIRHPLTALWRVFWVLTLGVEFQGPVSGVALALLRFRAANQPRPKAAHHPARKLEKPPTVALDTVGRAPDLRDFLGRTRGRGQKVE